jgi:hypothetical protein
MPQSNSHVGDHPARRVVGAVRIQKARAHHPHLGASFQRLDQSCDAAWLWDHVGVEKAHIGSGGSVKALVAGCSVASVPSVDEYANVRVDLLEPIDAAVPGGVVHDDELRSKRPCRVLQMRNAGPQVVAGVIVDDHYRYLGSAC